MNMQAIMRQAQQMQSDIMKIQKELEKTEYEGNSSLVTIVLNGKKEMLKLTIKDKENLNSDDMDILEDMIVVAFNEAMKKVDADKEKKLNKYQGLAGMM
ncbi:nucleoid-associated protein FPR_28110 [Clostridium sp. CAG:762]|nr:nucleoid-associated protein FPR_28110 [Clostridium sp. CAG:762]